MNYAKTFTIEVKGVPYVDPNYYATEDMVKAHFQETFGKVHEVSFIRNFGTMFDEYLKLADIARQLEL